MSEFDQNTQGENTQNNNGEQASSVYSYSYSDINQGENATADQQNRQTYTSGAGTGYQQNAYQDQNTYNYNPYGGQNAGGHEKHHRNGNGKIKQFFSKGNFGNKLLKVVAIALVFGLVAGGTFSGVTYAVSKKTGVDLTAATAKTLTTNDSVDSTAVSTATTVSDVSDIVENVMPAIVAVTNISYTEYRSMFGQTKTYESESAGSGIIVSQDNDYLYIATNNHVVSGAESLTITFNDGSAAPATIKGTDSSVDLAVVAVALSDVEDSTMDAIKVATLGDSDQAQVGESSVVIGNALGYGQSVTTGVISALNRSVSETNEQTGETTESDAKLIQTDAAINPGNSGGALVNASGEVIGINSSKLVGDSVEGVGYAIPISDVSDLIQNLMNQATKTKVAEKDQGAIGIKGMSVPAEYSKQLNMPEGVYVSEITKGGGAEAAGMAKGSVITAIDGTTVSSMDDLQEQFQYYAKGDKVSLTIQIPQSNGEYEEKTVEVTLGAK